MRKIILFELNEVPFPVIDDFCRREPGSFLARALPRCAQYTTMAADQRQLDPWITWPTFHRGVADMEHGIMHLGQDLDRVDAEFPPIWRLLRESGRSVGVFGSLHSSHVPEDIESYDFYLPDYFAGEAVAFPRRLGAFQEFNLAMTRQSARNVDRGIPIKPALAFLRDAPSLGLSPATGRRLAGQLVTELRQPERKIRRRSLQPLVMFDIFFRLLKQQRPDFATFYSNHVAAAMHRYWAALFPDEYDPFPGDEAWRESYAAEIPFAMEQFSNLFRALVRFAHEDPEYLIVVASSMGQAAIPSQRTFDFLTITDMPAFMRTLGVPDGAWEQRNAMVPCVSVVVDEEARAAFRLHLSALGVQDLRMIADERPVHPLSYDERDGGFFHIFVQVDNYAGPATARLGERELPFAELGLGMMAHEDGVNCTAQHVPQGSLLVYDPQRRRDGSTRGSVSTLDFVPSVLETLGVPAPDYLRGEAAITLAG